MGLIQIDLFCSLDLVAQAPGGPEEDPEGGFAFGGWQAPLIGPEDGEHIDAGLADVDALLLGRKTYDIFAGYWPHQPDAGIAHLFNGLPKYVASRGTPSLDWARSTQLGPDLASAVRELRDRHEDIHVIGSVDLVQSLLAERLFDRLNLFVYPVILGAGKRVFDGGAAPASLRLREPAVTSAKGAVILHYELADGEPQTGDMSDLDAGEASA